jgi:hypothetical protein
MMFFPLENVFWVLSHLLTNGMFIYSTVSTRCARGKAVVLSNTERGFDVFCVLGQVGEKQSPF